MGHIDHGKTTLTAAGITKTLADRVRETCLRSSRMIEPRFWRAGVDHDQCVSHVEYETNNGIGGICRVTRIKIKNRSLAAQVDGAILVVAATDGPMPQTEHVVLVRQVGCRRSWLR